MSESFLVEVFLVEVVLLVVDFLVEVVFLVVEVVVLLDDEAFAPPTTFAALM